MARLCQGQLHIRTPGAVKALRSKPKVDITRKALEELDTWANAGSIQPTVRILTGDVNLKKEVAMSICQHDAGEPDVDRHWHVESSSFALPGDVAFIKGAQSMPFDIAIGYNYIDRGVSHDQHDFFGMTLQVPLGHAIVESTIEKSGMETRGQTLQDEEQRAAGAIISMSRSP